MTASVVRRAPAQEREPRLPREGPRDGQADEAAAANATAIRHRRGVGKGEDGDEAARDRAASPP